MNNTIKSLIKDSIRTKENLYAGEAENIARCARAIIKSLKSGGKVLVFGNGGSAADSQHIVAELVGRFKKERRPLPAIALTTNTSILSALANDYGYDVAFSRQVEALANKKDIAIGISTSGNSKNVIEAIKKARSIGLSTIALTGGKGGRLKEISDMAIIVESDDTPRIQEAHILIGHILCELIEKEMFK